MKISFRNTDFFYTSEGEGNPIVLLHGFLESSTIWKPFVPELTKKHQVITVDLPGHGKSGNISEIHSMELMAEAVQQVLQTLNIGKAVFLGHSMGGYVSLAFLELFPDQTAGLVLLNSTPEADTEEKQKNREKSINVLQQNKSAYVNMAISNLVTPDNNIKFSKEIAKIKDEALSFSEKGITAALKGMKIRTDRTALLSGFTGPKYIIAGKQDPVLEFRYLQQVAGKCNCIFSNLPDGHLSYIENKEQLTKMMHFID